MVVMWKGIYIRRERTISVDQMNEVLKKAGVKRIRMHEKIDEKVEMNVI